MSINSIITAENIGKRYMLNHQNGGGYRKFSDTLIHAAKAPMRLFQSRAHDAGAKNLVEPFWALKDVSFQINQGDVVGIIGRNGAGKSTLLKILSRITEPTTGRIGLKGRVASLLEVGTGFHPELTGRENIYLNGAILGMTKAEIKSKFDEIVAFAEIERFLDTPVKRYSSGMYVRLAFAVAAHLEPEILIVDEVLAVGDAQFQAKCLGKMQDVARGGGRTVLFVSHNLSSILGLCGTCIVLERGRLVFKGDTREGVSYYQNADSVREGFSRSAQSNGNPTLVAGNWVDEEHSSTLRQIRLRIESKAAIATSIDFRVSDHLGNAVGFGSLGALDPAGMITLQPGQNEVRVSFDVSHWAIGTYHVSIDLTVPEMCYFDRADRCLSFDHVRAPTNGSGRAMNQNWGYGSIEIPVTKL